MKITVITVCRNAEGTIADALNSVAAQWHRELEHIVMDGLSTDGTLEIISRNKARVARVVSERDAGIYDAMNKGIALASGEFTCFLNADDMYARNDALQLMAEALQRMGADAVHGNLSYVRATNPERVTRRWIGREHTPGLCLHGWAPAHPTFLTRTSLLREVGGFDTRYPLAADFDLMCKLLEGKRIRSTYLPLVLVHMREGGATNRSLKNIWQQNQEILDSIGRHGPRPAALPFLARKVLSRIGQRWRAKAMSC